MTITTVTPPNGEPVSLPEAKAFLRIGHDGEDALVAHLIAGARARLETAASRVLVTRTMKHSWSDWPAAVHGEGIPIRPGPIQNIVSIEMIHMGGAVEDLAAHFLFDPDRERLCLREFTPLPHRPFGAHIEVTFIAGYGAPGDVPADLKLAVKRLIAQVYSRGETPARGEALPPDVEAILEAYRQVRL